jgi:hypothetical protein
MKKKWPLLESVHLTDSVSLSGCRRASFRAPA